VFEWGGYFGTTYWADPKERLIGVIYTQLFGVSNSAPADRYKVMVYSAIND
jgi:CubicO group peptidase (beta-lactamase class C family)